jgi:citrate lyase subunit beta/citryl-CoA lyase
MVARANKMHPIDAAYIHVHDLEGLERHLQKGRLLGYAGMWVLHPKQNELTNKCYSPSADEVKNANEMLRIYEMAQKDDKGVAIIEGKFIGPPIVVAAKKTIKKHELIEARKKLIEGSK